MRPRISLFCLWMLMAGYIATAVFILPSYAAQQSGTLQVIIEPKEAVQAGAKWKVGINPWKKSGESEHLPVGQHRIDFTTPAGWILSVPVPVNIVPGQVTRANGTFRRQTGSLMVTMQPQGAVTAGAQWRADGGAWQNSGSTLSDVAAGQLNIEYKEVPGWIRPAKGNVTIVIGQTQQATGTYIPSTGSLRVTLQPDYIEAAGGQWRIDGGSWRLSRQSLDNITVGPHQVEYSDVAGWVKPPPAPVNIIGSPSTQVTGTYQPGTRERIIVAGNVQAEKLIRRITPVYPPLARQARVQGTVRFAAIIGGNGTILQVQPISGHPLIVQAATEAVRQWTYSPTLVNGVPAEVITQIDVVFTMSM